MTQHDMVLKLPICNLEEIHACGSEATHVMAMKPGTFNEYAVIEDENGSRAQHLCELAVPSGCPRVQCFNEANDRFLPCRMNMMIQGQSIDNYYWMKLPCSLCPEERKLHATTEGFIHGEDTGGN
jgi:hypothetical protein